MRVETKVSKMTLEEYIKKVAYTDKLPKDISPILFGVYGEVGSIMTAVKKEYREPNETEVQRQNRLEEFGDTLWYIAALCRRLELPLEEIIKEVNSNGKYDSKHSTSKAPDGSTRYSTGIDSGVEVDLLQKELMFLGKSVADLFDDTTKAVGKKGHLNNLVDGFLRTLNVADFSLKEVVCANWRKISDRFLEPESQNLPNFDCEFSEDERLPSKFSIEIRQNKSEQCYLRWKGVKIGDPLTDSISDRDGYRYHDVFHFAYAAILHWSPVIRSLIKHRRRSNRIIDEEEDGGRAKVVEEGLTAWIFTQAKHRDYFEGCSTLSFDILKTVRQFTEGYEVNQCPLYLWEKAILEGYRVFRELLTC